jgi:hypothetical protein
MLNFTASEARQLSSTHTRELETNATILRNAAGQRGYGASKEIEAKRKVGVLLYATNEAAMEADLRAAGFSTSKGPMPGYIRGHW